MTLPPSASDGHRTQVSDCKTSIHLILSSMKNGLQFFILNNFVSRPLSLHFSTPTSADDKCWKKYRMRKGCWWVCCNQMFRRHDRSIKAGNLKSCWPEKRIPLARAKSSSSGVFCIELISFFGSVCHYQVCKRDSFDNTSLKVRLYPWLFLLIYQPSVYFFSSFFVPGWWKKVGCCLAYEPLRRASFLASCTHVCLTGCLMNSLIFMYNWF